METLKTLLGPGDQGRSMSLPEFVAAKGSPGYRYELARGVVQRVEIPGLPHGKVLHALERQLFAWDAAHPRVIQYQASGDRCAIRLPGARSERHPDLAIYLTPAPDPVSPWDRWVPEIVVEVVSEGGEARYYDEKRSDYLAAGVHEYWILDPALRCALVLQRTGDTFRELRPVTTYATPLLPGFALDLSHLFGG